ncbi:MAG TPA: hypothetical protein VFC37_06355 [Terracidiphilus sp.]|nr:hypothetical protein [Terracidiphilus sp.]
MQSFIRRSGSLLCASAFLLQCGPAIAEQASVVLTRGNTTIVLEPYAPNILRVTLSLKREPALVGPRYGLVAKPVDTGWSASQTAQADVYRSDRIVATVDRDLPDNKPPVQTIVDISEYFNGSALCLSGCKGACHGSKTQEFVIKSNAVIEMTRGASELACPAHL